LFTEEEYKKGIYWHYPCGSKEDPTPAVMDCDFECEFSRSIRTDALKYEFESSNEKDKQVCTKFEAFYVGSDELLTAMGFWGFGEQYVN